MQVSETLAGSQVSSPKGGRSHSYIPLQVAHVCVCTPREKRKESRVSEVPVRDISPKKSYSCLVPAAFCSFWIFLLGSAAQWQI